MPQSRVRRLSDEEFADYLTYDRSRPTPVPSGGAAPGQQTTLDDILNWARWGLAGASLVPHPIIKGIGAAGSLGLGAYDTYRAAQEGDIGGAVISGGLTALGGSQLARLRKLQQARQAAQAASGSTQAQMAASNAQVAASVQAAQAAGRRNPLTGQPMAGGPPPPGPPPPAPPPTTGPTIPGGGGPRPPAPPPAAAAAPPPGQPGDIFAALQASLARAGNVTRGGRSGLAGVAAANAPALQQAIATAQAGVTPVTAAVSGMSSPEARQAMLAAAAAVAKLKGPAFLKKLGPPPAFTFGGRSLAVEFENPIERAAYQIAAGIKPRSAADAKLVKYVIDATNLDEHTARAYGTQIRNRLKEMAAAAPDAKKLTVPNGGKEPLERAIAHMVERERVTGMTAAQRSAQAQGEKAQRLAREAADKAALGDTTQLPVLLKSFNGLVEQVNRTVKAGKGVPEDMRTALSESLQLLTAVSDKLPEKQSLTKILAKGVQALTAANTTPSAATSTLLTSVRKVTAKQAKAAAAKAANPQAAGVENLTTAVAGKLGVSGTVLGKVADALRKAGSTAKTPRQKKDLKDLGFTMSELLVQLGAPVAGAVGGWEAGQQLQPEGDERDPKTWGFAGAAAGALAAMAGTNMVMNRSQLSGLAKKAINWNRFSLLSSPGAIGRANMGAVSSVFLLAAQRMIEGRFGDAAKGLAHLTSQSAKARWVKAAFGNPVDYLDDQSLRAQFASRAPRGTGITNWPGRAIAAGDVLSTNAIMKMGYSYDDAIAANLSSEPVTKWGQNVMSFFGETVKKKVTNPLTGAVTEKIIEPILDAKAHPGLAMAASYVSPFTRTMVNTIEQGVRHSPLGMGKWGQATFNQTPKEAAIRASLGTLGGVYGGKKLAENTSAEFDPLLIAAGGPMALPVFVGQRIARGSARDVPWQTVVQQATEEIPMIGEQFGIQDIGGRMVPAALRDVARAIDPAWEREKGPASIIQQRRSQGGPVDRLVESLQTPLGGAIHRLPILRESLPERFMGVDAFGQPHYKTDRPMFIPDVSLRGTLSGRPEIILPKVLTSTPIQNPPRLPLNHEMAQRFKDLEDAVPELGQTITAPMMPQFPEMENQMRMMGMRPQPMDRDTRAAALRAKGITTETLMRQLDQMPGFWEMPADQRHMLAREIFEKASQMGSRVTTPLLQGATMMPGMRGDITGQLQDYIRMMEGMR